MTRDNAELQDKLKGAVDLDAAVAIAYQAGFDVRKADWLKHQASKLLEMGDEELERAVGGTECSTPVISAKFGGNCI